MIAIFSFIGASFFLGITMKGADLCNEHKCKFFIADHFFLGITWGTTAAYIISINNIVGVIYVSLIISFILRAKIDYYNHGIGASIVLVYYIYKISNNYKTSHLHIFALSLAIFIITGILHDYHIYQILFRVNKLNSKRIQKFFPEIIHTLISYILLPFILSILWSNISIFISLILFAFGYEIARMIGPILSKSIK